MLREMKLSYISKLLVAKLKTVSEFHFVELQYLYDLTMIILIEASQPHTYRIVLKCVGCNRSKKLSN